MRLVFMFLLILCLILIITHKQIQGYQDNESHPKEATYPNISVPIIVKAGWNLVSLPVNVQDASVQNIFPTSISPAYSYKNWYNVEDTIKRCDGYWLKFAEDDTIWIDGQKKYVDTIYLNQGWNIIGSSFRNVHVNDIHTIPKDIIGSNYYTYQPDIGYSIADTIEPGKAYWVKVEQVGIGIMAPSWKNLGFHDKLAKRLTFAEPYLYVCAGRDGLWRKNIRQESSNWEYLGLADTLLPHSDYGVQDVVIDLEDSDKLLVAYDPGNYQEHVVNRTFNGGISWAPADSGLEWYDNGNRYYCSIYRFLQYPEKIIGAGEAIFTTHNFGDNWQNLSYVGGLSIFAFEHHPINDNIIWLSLETNFWWRGIHRSNNFGSTWAYVNIQTIDPYAMVYSISFDYLDTNIVYLGKSGGILKTINNGQTWTEYTYPGIFRDILNDPIVPTHLWAGVGPNLAETHDGGVTWQIIENPISMEILDMMLDGQNKKIFIGTYSGVYSFEP